MQPAARALLLSLAATLIVAAGCTTPGEPRPASSDQAERLLRRGDATGAAEMYERLAQNNPPPARNDFALAAARAWLGANRTDEAQRALDLAGNETRAPQALELGMLRAEVAVARGQYPAAWQLVSRLQQPADAAAATRLLQLRQQVALRAGQPLEAVRAGIAREAIAATDPQRVAARRELLAGLREAIEGGLRIDPATSNEPLVRGWLELAQIAVDAGRSPLTADSRVARWRSRYPAHPAATIVDSEILRPGERPSDNRRVAASTGPIALLLPLTAPQYAGAAGLVRRGFETAVARVAEAERPALRVYDTSAMTVESALQKAQADGAGFIAGPLLKDEVQAAYDHRPASLPLLLLNMLPDGGFAGSQVYQFALAPEDEARQIARQIAGSGRRNVVMFAPAGDWGTRVAAAFTEELRRGGGNILAQDIYDPRQADLTAQLAAAVPAALGIDEARARARRIQDIIGGTVEMEAHPRPDVDAIFVAGDNATVTRQINPLLRHFEADTIPTYVTQQGLAQDRNENRDLDGMRVLNLPWDLDNVGPVADLRASTEEQWRGQAQSRLFAFGYDAGTLAMAIRRGASNWPLSGLTGRMQPDPDGRIERSMNWGVLKGGQVQAFDPVAN
jgi:outer membrane PBP1 activator LpoA protein